MNSNHFASDVVAWLMEQSGKVVFGEITVKIICHQGARRIERSVTEKEDLKQESSL